MGLKFFKIGLIVLTVFMVACDDTAKPSAQALPQNPQSIITPDWNVAGTLTALGLPPVATGDVKSYPDWSLEPALPNGTIDLGARFNINPELAHQLSADLVIDSAFYSHMSGLYGDVPVYFYHGVAQKEVRHWDDYANATRELAKAVGRERDAERYLADSRAELATLGKTFKGSYPHINRLAVVQFASSQQIRSYTDSSPFAPALQEMGLSLYTFGGGNVWGSVDIGLGELTALGRDTCLVVIEPFSPMLQTELSQNALWQGLGFGSKRCLLVLPPVWAFGEIPSMIGFARALNQS